MKKIFSITAACLLAIGTLLFFACGKENLDNNALDSIGGQETKTAYPPDPSWIHVSSNIAVLRSHSQIFWNCTEQVQGYFCGVLLEQATVEGPAVVYVGSGKSLGMQIKNIFLEENQLSELIDSATHGFLTFHADIVVESESLQEQLGFDIIPAGRYPACTLMDTAIYIQFCEK